MLVIKKENPPANISIDIDEYIPFTIAVISAVESSPLYWRSGDGKNSLVEIGLDRYSGSVCSVTLTAINPKKVEETSAPIRTDLRESFGMAVFDIGAWLSDSNNYSDSFQDEFDNDLVLVIGEDYLALLIENSGEPVRYIINGQLRFSITANGVLSAIEILDLDENQIGRLRQK